MSELERCLILSSGRCGSTLLSDLIATEPDTLSIQESLVVRDRESWASDNPISGTDYWTKLITPTLQWKTAVRIGAIPSEIRYPSTGRWAENLAVLPTILKSTLPAISEDPDSLFDLLATQVPDFPAQTFAQHHLMFLDLLASLARRPRWVERSGSSNSLADQLLTKFPLDKVVYLTRGQADTALSMSRHPAFQFGVIRHGLRIVYGFDPYSRTPSANAGNRPIPDELRCLLPEHMTMQTLREQGGKIQLHKLNWTWNVRIAETSLREYPPRQLLTMRYEDILATPDEELTRLGEFLGFADPAGWAVQAAGRVRRPAAHR
jgi:putative sulfotransferase